MLKRIKGEHKFKKRKKSFLHLRYGEKLASRPMQILASCNLSQCLLAHLIWRFRRGCGQVMVNFSCRILQTAL